MKDNSYIPVAEDYDDPVHFYLLSLFFGVVAVNLFYSLSKWKNLLVTLKSTQFFRDSPAKKGGHINHNQEPAVTIQICSYNEGSVVLPTIDSACSVDWPLSKLQVHVCDDSTDPISKKIIDDHILHWKEQGVKISVKRRPNRTGYKAGSLRWHFDAIDTEYVVHLDADHRITTDFLRLAMNHFFDARGNALHSIGLVQAPWGYYNMNQNWLTQADSLSLDIHHVIEQTGRSAAHQAFGFNGTGGIWRKEAIAAGGGWNWDTVTEDLALSYQAFRKGYRFVFVRDIPQELELPDGLLAHIQQKHRWTKGFLQVFRNDCWTFMTCQEIDPITKFEILAHVTGPFGYVLFLLGFIAFPFLMTHDIDYVVVRVLVLVPALEFLIAALCAVYSKVASSTGRKLQRGFFNRTCRLPYLLVLIALQGGISCFQVKALAEGLFSRDATFLATPKKGSSNFVKNQLWDDLTALIGIFIGLQRVSFLLSNDMVRHELGGSHFFFTAINALLCFGFFWVNGGFLIEKYGRKILD